jgi:hypothetical protein
MDIKQTAVKWLIKKLTNRENGIFDGFPHLSVGEIYEQAKEMEKQQIIDAIDSFYDYKNWSDELPTKGKQYYNETFGK